MAGRGPQPKDPSKRARRNASPELRLVPAKRAEQPKLPAITILQFNPATGALERRRLNWCKRTQDWWKKWAESPLANDFTEVDWEELLTTALLHHRYWGQGDIKVAAELRLRVAKFGATPEDRARLRITFAIADDHDERTAQRRGGRTEESPYSGLQAVDMG